MVSKKVDIGLIGLAGAGKDTAAFGLMREGWHRKGFADLLKMRALDIGWDGVKDAKGRKLLQVVGCAVREYDPEFWVREAFARIDSRRPYVWTDVRFNNEAQAIREIRKGILVRIVNPACSSDGHVSETELLEIVCDHEIVNDGSKEELQQKLIEIVKLYDRTES
jgi:hypothetical protein